MYSSLQRTSAIFKAAHVVGISWHWHDSLEMNLKAHPNFKQFQGLGCFTSRFLLRTLEKYVFCWACLSDFHPPNAPAVLEIRTNNFDLHLLMTKVTYFTDPCSDWLLEMLSCCHSHLCWNPVSRYQAHSEGTALDTLGLSKAADTIWTAIAGSVQGLVHITLL